MEVFLQLAGQSSLMLWRCDSWFIYFRRQYTNFL